MFGPFAKCLLIPRQRRNSGHPPNRQLGPRTDIARVGYRPADPPWVASLEMITRRDEIFGKLRSAQHARRSPEPQIRLWLAYLARSMIERTSMLPRRASGILEATSTAS